MENRYDKLVIAAGHNFLFNRKVFGKEIVEIISKYPTILWLDIFSKIEAMLLISRSNVLDVQEYLCNKIFPSSTLSRIRKINTKTPGEKIQLFTRGQLNVARKLAIIYGQLHNSNAVISSVDLSKFLLASQDIHNDYDEKVAKPEDLENFSQFNIRSGYLNRNINVRNILIRAREMCVVLEKEVEFYDNKKFSDFFKENVGLTISQVIALSFALVSGLFQNEKTLFDKTTVINQGIFFQNVFISQEEISSIIDCLVVDFDQLKETMSKTVPSTLDFSTLPFGYDLSIFKKTPLIRFSDGSLICGSLYCFSQKVTENIIWLPKKSKKFIDKSTEDKLIKNLMAYRGKLFEKYLKKLCLEMTKKNSLLSHYYIGPNLTSDHEEVGDSLLVQEDNILIFEAKSRQFKEKFKYTGEWEEDKLFWDELIEKSAMQIQIASNKIMRGEVNGFPIDPKKIRRIFPIIVTYDPVPTHGKIQKFIRVKISKLGLLQNKFFAPLEILDISDIEQALDYAHERTLVDLFEKKHMMGIDAKETSFHNFLYYFFQQEKCLSNNWQAEQFKKFLEEIFQMNLKFKI